VRRGLLILGIAAVLLGALGASAYFGRRKPIKVPPGFEIAESEISGPGTRGLSGLARDDRGTFFAVPERAPLLLPFTIEGDRPKLGSRIEIEGLPPETDLEGLAISGDRIFLATEHHEARTEDDVLVVKLEGDKARVVDRISVSYAAWGIEAKDNDGLEGICVASGRLFVSVETVAKKDGNRFAPIGEIDLERRTLVAHRLRLTTKEGKISSLDCRSSGEEIELVAIERHYGISRVLRARSTFLGAPIELLPEIVIDLRKVYRKSPPNFEGIAFSGDRSLVLVSDNDPGFGRAVIASIARDP
jgi:hypothetical protein